MLCARLAPFAPVPGGPSLMRLMLLPRLLRTGGRAAASTVAHRSRRIIRERERQLKKVVTGLSRDEMAGMHRLLQRRLQQEALLEGASASSSSDHKLYCDVVDWLCCYCMLHHLECHCPPLPSPAHVAPPTQSQLRRLVIQEMMPFIGFGFLDNAIMIIAVGWCVVGWCVSVCMCMRLPRFPCANLAAKLASFSPPLSPPPLPPVCVLVCTCAWCVCVLVPPPQPCAHYRASTLTPLWE